MNRAPRWIEVLKEAAADPARDDVTFCYAEALPVLLAETERLRRRAEKAEAERDAFMSTYHAVHDVLLGKPPADDPTAGAVAARIASLQTARPETARLRRRVETLEGRLARVLWMASRLGIRRYILGGSSRYRGRVWSGRRAGRGTKP